MKVINATPLEAFQYTDLNALLRLLKWLKKNGSNFGTRVEVTATTEYGNDVYSTVTVHDMNQNTEFVLAPGNWIVLDPQDAMSMTLWFEPDFDQSFVGA